MKNFDVLLNPEYVAVLAAVVSGLVSIVVAWWTSIRTFRLETNKVRLSAQQLTFEKLQEIRIKVYPELFAMLSDLPKTTEKNPTVAINLGRLREDVNIWDTAYSIFLGEDTANVCYDFRMVLAKTVAKAQPAVSRKLLPAASRLELALRGDLGIHGLKIRRNDLSPRWKTRY